MTQLNNNFTTYWSTAQSRKVEIILIGCHEIKTRPGQIRISTAKLENVITDNALAWSANMVSDFFKQKSEDNLLNLEVLTRIIIPLVNPEVGACGSTITNKKISG